MAKTVIPVILCGGSGTRLWPASRDKHPKQFLNLMGDFSLLQNTMRRALRIAGVKADQLVTVTLGALSKSVHSQIVEMENGGVHHILSEPSARDTAAAVAFAAAYVSKVFGGDTIMWILPADNHIGDENALAEAFRDAFQAADKGHLVTFGIRPTRPETGYGYIRLGQGMEGGAIYKAEKFVEKPNLETARSYLADGKYLWNSGMFLFRTDVVLGQYEQHAAEILSAVRDAMKFSNDHREPCSERYSAIGKQPFDKAIMEKSDLVAVVPCNPQWSDIGSWESLWELRQKDEHGNVVDGRTACHEATNCLIQASDKLVACAGVDNLVIIETADSILIANKSNGDAMKAMVNRLKAVGAREVIEPPAQLQPWSMTKTLDHPGYNVREIIVQPGERLALNMHAHKSKFWTVIEGQALIEFSGEQKTVSQQQTAFIPAGIDYTLVNKGEKDLKIVEVCHDEQGNTIQFTPKRVAA